MDVQAVIEKIKDLVQKGSVSRIIVRRSGNQILNIPVNVGVVGAAVGLAASKWILLGAVLATIGFGCTVEIQKTDGNIVNVVDEESNRKIHSFASETVERVKESIPVSINIDVKRDESSDQTKDADTSDDRFH